MGEIKWQSQELLITRIIDAPREPVESVERGAMALMRWWGTEDYTAPTIKSTSV